MLKACLFLCLLLPLFAYSHGSTSTAFQQSKRVIDSLCNIINKDSLLKKSLVEFSRDKENFVSNGLCYVDVHAKELKKFIFNDVEHNLTSDTFYFNNKALIKVTGHDYTYYFTDSLRDNNDKTVPAEKVKTIIETANLALDAIKDIKRYLY